MRILVLNWQDRLNPQAGGAETHLHQIFGRLAEGGTEVSLLVSGWPGSPSRARIDNMEVHRAGQRFTFPVAAPAYYRKHLRDRSFDVVVEDLNKVPLWSPLWAVGPVTLLVHHLFGRTAFQEAPLPMAAATWIIEKPLGLVYRSVPTMAVSRSTAADLGRRGLAEGEVAVIPNGVDLERCSPRGNTARFPEPTLLYLGRLKRYKRVDLPIRAVAALRRRGRPVYLVIAGAGDHADALRALATELGVEDAVEFRGFVTEDEKIELFRRAWIHVLTSVKEGWGITVLEAAACGTPTVASDSPGLRDSVRDGETGLLVPHEDEEALAGAIAGLIDEPARREAMGRAAARFAEQFTWDRAARDTEDFLRAVVGSD